MYIYLVGNGPISLCGVHLSALPLDLDEEDEDEDTSEDEEVPRLVEPKVNKDFMHSIFIS